MTLLQFVYYPILGKPLILYVGMLGLILLLTAATIGKLILKGKTKLTIGWHLAFVYAALTIALLHGLTMLYLYLK